jgi:multicomponent Na+:H+ antiporter subunit D
VDYVPYTPPHVMAQMQLLLFSALAFTLLLRSGIYPAEIRAINLDTDWSYRKGTKGFLWLIYNPLGRLGEWGSKTAFETVPSAFIWFSRNPLAIMKMLTDRVSLLFSGEQEKIRVEQRLRHEKNIYPGDVIKHWPIGSTVLWVTLFLLAYLLAYYL